MLFWTPHFSVLDYTFFVFYSTFWLDSMLKIELTQPTFKFWYPSLPAGQPPVLKLLRCPILQFFAPQGRHDSQINMKFGTAEGPLRHPKFHVAMGIFGDFRPPKHENLPKNFQSCKLFRPAGANLSSDYSEIYMLYARNVMY